MAVDMSANIIDTRPAITSVSAGGLLRYATFRIGTPVDLAKLSAMTVLVDDPAPYDSLPGFARP